MTRQGIYPSLPAPNGVPWSEYVRTHRNRPQSVDDVHPGQGEQISLIPETLKPQVGPPSSDIIGEGAAIFTDMTEMKLGILDKQ